jgi:hypothetical protein
VLPIFGFTGGEIRGLRLADAGKLSMGRMLGEESTRAESSKKRQNVIPPLELDKIREYSSQIDPFQ